MASETIIAEGVKINGTVSFKGSAKIDGDITGDITSDETITIGKNANVRAKVNTKNAVISGSFEGTLNASGQVDISSTGKFTGDLIQPNALLSIEKGGIFKGRSIIGTNIEKDNK